MKLNGLEPKTPLDIPVDKEPDRVSLDGIPKDLKSDKEFDALLRQRREKAGIQEIGSVRPAAETNQSRISVGMMRQEISSLIETLGNSPDQSREDRVALWTLKGELRKLVALDEYVSGFIRG